MRNQLVALALVAVLGGVALAADRRVGPGQTYAKIQDAVDAAQPGDRILVARGTYAESVSVRKDKLQLVAAKGVVWDGTVGETPVVCLDVRASAVLVQGFAFRGGMHHVMSAGPDMRISKCTSSGALGQGFTIWGAHGLVESCTVTGAGSLGIYVEGDDATVRTNRVSGVGGFGIYVWGARATVDRNVVRNAVTGGIQVLGDAAKVTRNDSAATQGIGVQATGVAVLVQSNRASHTGSAGVLARSTDGKVVSNTVFATRGAGVWVRGDRISVASNRVDVTFGDLPSFILFSDTAAGGGIVERNRVTDGRHFAYMAQTTGVSFRDNSALRCGSVDEGGFSIYGDDNVLTANTAQDGDGSGFVVWGNRNALSKCSASLNTHHGFLVGNGSDNSLSACSATANDGDGLQNLGQTTDVAGGAFSGNRVDVTNAGTFDRYENVKAVTGGATTQPDF